MQQMQQVQHMHRMQQIQHVHEIHRVLLQQQGCIRMPQLQQLGGWQMPQVQQGARPGMAGRPGDTLGGRMLVGGVLGRCMRPGGALGAFVPMATAGVDPFATITLCKGKEKVAPDHPQHHEQEPQAQPLLCQLSVTTAPELAFALGQQRQEKQQQQLLLQHEQQKARLLAEQQRMLQQKMSTQPEMLLGTLTTTPFRPPVDVQGMQLCDAVEQLDEFEVPLPLIDESMQLCDAVERLDDPKAPLPLIDESIQMFFDNIDFPQNMSNAATD